MGLFNRKITKQSLSQFFASTVEKLKDAMSKHQGDRKAGLMFLTAAPNDGKSDGESICFVAGTGSTLMNMIVSSAAQNEEFKALIIGSAQLIKKGINPQNGDLVEDEAKKSLIKELLNEAPSGMRQLILDASSGEIDFPDDMPDEVKEIIKEAVAEMEKNGEIKNNKSNKRRKLDFSDDISEFDEM